MPAFMARLTRYGLVVNLSMRRELPCEEPVVTMRNALILSAFVPLSCLGQGNAPASAADFQASIWASSCMACHGTDGRAEGTGLAIAGRPEQELLGYLLQVRDGRRQATVMHQHAKGYSEDELRRIARYFSKVK